MGNKLGRNELCWCGSGLKYKKCHLDRERQEPPQFHQLAEEQRRAFNFKDCLVPESMKAQCSGIIVKAHTVPKSDSLQKIARNGHVYGFVPSLENIFKYSGRLCPELRGIKLASTFTRLCSVHDDKIFSKIEKQPFENSPEQCFLLGYRALIMELYKKKGVVASSVIRRDADKGEPLHRQLEIQEMNSLMDIGASAGLSNTEFHKARYDEILLSGNFNDVRSFIIELAIPPPVMCSGALFPEQDYFGNQLQDICDLSVVSNLITLNSFHSGNHGLIVFTWLANSDNSCQPFIKSLREMPIDRITDGIIRLFFEYSENVQIQPDWWDKLEYTTRELLIDRFANSVNMELDRNPCCIAEDGIKIDNWPITSMKSVGF